MRDILNTKQRGFGEIGASSTSKLMASKINSEPDVVSLETSNTKDVQPIQEITLTHSIGRIHYLIIIKTYQIFCNYVDLPNCSEYGIK